jgi:purine-cytosine permease-like protein
MNSFDSNILTGEGLAEPRHWRDVVGAWLGIGTAPGALIIGAGMASRHGGAVPLLSFLIGFVAMFSILWFSGLVGIAPPTGEGLRLTDLSPRYFGPWMQRILAALIALGMIGWFGFNVGLGGAALSSLLHVPDFIGPLLIGVAVLVFSILGIHRWNGLAALTTIAVIVLVALIATRYSAQMMPVTLSVHNPLLIIVDIATFIGYVAVFSVRAPDFTAGFVSRQDLFVSVLLLCTPVVLISLAGIGLQQGTGSTDLVGVLAQPGNLAFGNLLVFLAVVAPSFTILYSGTPALRAAIGLNETVGMLVISAIGLGLAIARFDLVLIKWLGVLAALLPPLIVPMATEAARRRRGQEPHLVTIWLWLPGALVSVLMTIQNRPTAALVGLLISSVFTLAWYVIIDRNKNNH